MGSVWKDETSYSQGGRGRGKAEPRVWHEQNADVSVHRWLDLDGWFMTSRLDGVDNVALESTDIDGAKMEALRRVADIRQRRLVAIQSVLCEPSGGGTLSIEWRGDLGTCAIKLDCKSRAHAARVAVAVALGAEERPTHAVWIFDHGDMTTNEYLELPQ